MKFIPSIFLILASLYLSSQTRTEYVQKENQPIPDQGNGYYLNPIFPGNYGDPTLVKVGKDYFVAHSRGNAILIWQSRDLINWKPVTKHYLSEGYHTIWAIDMQYFNDKFHIYMPIRNYPTKTEADLPFGNFVIQAENPEGPWSDPIDLEISHPENGQWMSAIDPGFIQTPDGEKYLYVNHGWAVKLNEEGTKAVTVPKQYYDGWPIPTNWVVECMCLESPKLFLRGTYYYLVSAQGGTNGPSTAHMSVVARSKHPLGPWENSPYNPLHHTYSIDEPYWHQGHGTIFEDAYGDWWTIYHGRVNGFKEMGRPTLLMPIEWTEDDWPIQKKAYVSNALIPKPKGENIGHGLPLSDDFNASTFQSQWYISHEDRPRLQLTNGQLEMIASGTHFENATSISATSPNKSFELIIKVIGASKDAISGVSIGNEGILTDGEHVFFSNAPAWRHRHSVYPVKSKELWLKISNQQKDISFFYSTDGIAWIKFDDSIRSHDAYRYALISYGSGKVRFDDFSYKGLK